MGCGKPLTVRDFKSYNKELERKGVIIDPERRLTTIQEQIGRLCAEAGVELNVDDALLDQAVYTTEWPCAVLGNFKPEYLTVPQEVLMTSMKHHQGFFSVRDKQSGKLAPHFIAIANNEIYRRASASPELTGMTCVMTLAIVADGRLTIGHVGDTRLYKVRPSGLSKLTHDHSPVGEREDAREIGEYEAMRHPRRHEVFRDVGSALRDKDEPDYVEVIEDTLEDDRDGCAVLAFESLDGNHCFDKALLHPHDLLIARLGEDLRGIGKGNGF